MALFDDPNEQQRQARSIETPPDRDALRWLRGAGNALFGPSAAPQPQPTSAPAERTGLAGMFADRIGDFFSVPRAPTAPTRDAGAGRGFVNPVLVQPERSIDRMPPGNSRAGAGRGFVNPPLVSPLPAVRAMPGLRGTQMRRSVAPLPMRQAPGSIETLPSTQEAMAPDQQASGVRYSAFGGERQNNFAQLADGTMLRGDAALGAIGAHQMEPQGIERPVGIIRGMQQSVALPTGNFAQPYQEVSPELVADGRIQDALGAVGQGARDASNPIAAKQRGDLAIEDMRGTNRLAEQDLQNQGSARSAAISAGPGYAGVQQRRDEAASELALKRELGNRPMKLRGGQEPVFDPNGMFVGMRNAPDVMVDVQGNPLRGSGGIEQMPTPTKTPPPGAIDLLRRNPRLAADFDSKYGPGSAARILGR